MRKAIQAIIEAEADPERAALVICAWLEGAMDLQGNGWFDDDPEMIGWLSVGKEPK